ncbi:hypothetical protein LTR35_006060 [Friedmanniomyces endolithicus]|uniref:Transcriptional co-activator n=1 Tax=Friedmanniomyces endolithicus TaxID=329885 RepID=A0AAN6JFF5_9PEZI|nr:hypothetical protein LTR35_006060 [Friedmanniomyces endolithicus]KAK0301465.1 hypothetical protein LTS00_000614 [Friedmanniomyces endolithicus]KAK0322380.1 hypothetical protein LTR82_006833 [Friedmanniomyces endolithicus]KAK1014350.1 hypothetical protein LTR54_004002 [Friedmanniomyces endolithicus]
MNPAEFSLQTISPTVATRSLPAAQKNDKTPVPRVPLEPIYVSLKAALSDGWADYKAAVNAFVFGNLNQAELTWVIQPLLSTSPSAANSTDPVRSPVSALHLHNSLIVALVANISRDPPSSDVAPWVVATDKPATTSKNAGGTTGGNDGAEEMRLKREIMALHARDRRRIKALKDNSGGAITTMVNDGFKEMLTYRHELAVKPPTDMAPQSGGGLAKTNWDLEIRRRYAQPLASETLEFPSQSDMQNRIEPICAEEGLAGATQSTVQHCAELVEQAAEVHLKEMLSNLMSHSRSDAEGCVQTARYRRQLRLEEGNAERGVLQRSAGGLLPVELEMQASRQPLSAEDLRTAQWLGDVFVRQDRFLEETIALSRYPNFETGHGKVNGVTRRPAIVNGGASRDERAAAEDHFWTEGTSAEDLELMSVLDDCLAVG